LLNNINDMMPEFKAILEDRDLPMEFTVHSGLYGVTTCVVDDIPMAIRTGHAPCADGNDYELTHHEKQQLLDGADWVEFRGSFSLPTPFDSLALLVPNGTRLEFPRYSINQDAFAVIKRELRKADWPYSKVNGIGGFETGMNAEEAYDLLQSGKYYFQKINQSYFTTQKVARQMVGMAELYNGAKILEPSAGEGAIIEAIREVLPITHITAFEIASYRDKLSRFDNITVGDDFMHFPITNKFDRIIANPPFKNGLDVEHITKMVDHLRPGGVLVTLSMGSWKTRKGNKYEDFRRLMRIYGAHTIDIPKGTFKDSGTNISTTIIKLKKS